MGGENYDQQQNGGYQGQAPPSGYNDQGGALAGQFNQMAIRPLPPFQVSTTNLVGLPLNPAELFGMPPPDVRLPQGVS